MHTARSAYAFMLFSGLVAMSSAAQPSRVRDAIDFEASLRSAAYPEPSVASVAVHVPAGLDAHAPLHLVVYVHGLRGCLPVLMGKGETRCNSQSEPQLGWNLGARHDAAQTNTVLVVPRVVYGKRGGQPGTFGEPGGFRAFLSELLSGPLAARLGRPLTLQDVASITLVAHSAGYQTALAILEHGQVESLVGAVVLLDALYRYEERYAHYVAAHADAGLRLVVVHLRGGAPAREGRKLQQRLARALGAERVVATDAAGLREAVAEHPIVFAAGRPPHARVPEHHLAELLSALGLPARAAR